MADFPRFPVKLLIGSLAATAALSFAHTTPRQDAAPFRQALFSNFADPALVKSNGTWYAFATNSAAGIINQNYSTTPDDYGKANIALATSSDFVDWILLNYTSDPLARLGEWVKSDGLDVGARSFRHGTLGSDLIFRNTTAVNPWAPDILQRPSDGKFVIYYSATAANAAFHCVGAAVASEPFGPYEPLPFPFACPLDQGGAIDAAPIVDSDGAIYVAYKIDGNALGSGGDCSNGVPPLKDTPIMLQKVDIDGTTPIGSPVKILDRSDEFGDGPLVEAPSLILSDEGIYFLFFSSGCTRTDHYDIKYATASDITGPYVRATEPLLKTGDWGLLAPGSMSLRKDGEKWRMAFHARVFTDFGGIRATYLADIVLSGNRASFDLQT